MLLGSVSFINPVHAPQVLPPSYSPTLLLPASYSPDRNKDADKSGDYSGSCSETYTDSTNATFRTNSSCQSPEAVADFQSTCKDISHSYVPGRIGYFFIFVGATLQLLGVCSWCGVRLEAGANYPLLCTGFNIHWIAGLALLMWGCYWIAAASAFLFLFFASVALFFLPCLLAPAAGAIGVRINC